TATVPADQRPAPDRVVDIGAATAGALVQPVAAARAGVDDAVSAVLLCGGLTGAAGSDGHARLARALPARALRGGLAVAGLPGVVPRPNGPRPCGRRRARPAGVERRLAPIRCRSAASSGLLGRLVVGLGDQTLVQHLLVLAELRDRVLALASALRRLLLGSLLLGLALRGLLLGSLLVALPPRLDRVDQAALGTGPHAEHGQTCAAAVLPGRLHAARDGLVDEGLRAVARQRVGLLH